MFFDPTQHNPDDAKPQPIPDGDYELAVVDTVLKETASGNGQYLLCQCQVVSGEYSRRQFGEFFNIKNPNAETVRIAGAQLAAMCRAMGINHAISSHEDLRHKPFWAKVGHRRNKDTGDLHNTIKEYKRPLQRQQPINAVPLQQQPESGATTAQPDSAWM